MAITACYLVAAYVGASLWEATFHRHVLHAGGRARLSWRAWGCIGELLRLAHFFHQTLHHRRTFRRSPLVQFDSAAERQALESHLKGAIGRRAKLDRYGLTVTGPMEFMAFAGLPLLANSLAAIAVDPRLLPVGAFASVLPLLLSRHVHPLLHEPQPPGNAAGITARLRRTAAFQFLQAYHLLHHARRDANFNLLLGADWLLGQAMRPRKVRIKQSSVT